MPDPITTQPQGHKEIAGNCDDCSLIVTLAAHYESPFDVLPDENDWDSPRPDCPVCGGPIAWVEWNVETTQDRYNALLREVPTAEEREVGRWLREGERGMSSEAIVANLTNVAFRTASRRHPSDHPHDMDDFRRCEVLLRECPSLRPKLDRMAAISSPWSRLVARWDEIVGAVEATSPRYFRRREDLLRVDRAPGGHALDMLRDCVDMDRLR